MDFKWFLRMSRKDCSNDSVNIDYVWNGNDHYVVGCTGMMDSQMMMNGVWNKERESRASIADLDDLQELRCLFVREGWSEYFLGLWCHSCSRMHQEDTHWRDWVCLNIIHSGWESLSRVMWRGLRNVPLFSPLVASKVSLGKSSQSIHSMRITSHYQCAWTTILEFECIFTQLNGSQFRQV